MLRPNITRPFIPTFVASYGLQIILAMAACVPFQGCGGKDWHVSTYPAHGRVTINGEPAGGAVVELHSTNEAKPDVRNSRPWAVVKNDGTFSLSTYESGDGAPPGEYAVIVRWPPDVNQPTLVDRLGGAYARPDQSQWRVIITEGENELPPVEITAANVLPKR